MGIYIQQQEDLLIPKTFFSGRGLYNEKKVRSMVNGKCQVRNSVIIFKLFFMVNTKMAERLVDGIFCIKSLNQCRIQNSLIFYKISYWTELSDRFLNQSEVISRGQYKNGKRVGRWDILLMITKIATFFQLIDGGFYPESSRLKGGQWIELSDGFWFDQQVTLQGEYQNCKNVGRWNINYRNRCSNKNNQMQQIKFQIYFSGGGINFRYLQFQNFQQQLIRQKIASSFFPIHIKFELFICFSFILLILISLLRSITCKAFCKSDIISKETYFIIHRTNSIFKEIIFPVDFHLLLKFFRLIFL
ncbi:unnamed protein product [Paramecium octaurelia]|uniref:Transmembrane protein n=1 Tax=Paramecium octaurelia TaxID=43137 RepID=A0A8S1Y0G6_PAROT|nr:unnamed protein product [Paramecium octaurelia]